MGGRRGEGGVRNRGVRFRVSCPDIDGLARLLEMLALPHELRWKWNSSPYPFSDFTIFERKFHSYYFNELCTYNSFVIK